MVATVNILDVVSVRNRAKCKRELLMRVFLTSWNSIIPLGIQKGNPVHYIGTHIAKPTHRQLLVLIQIFKP